MSDSSVQMAATSQSFSLLQSRKFLFLGNKSTADVVDVEESKRGALRRLAKLCPSMDLIIVQSTNSSSTLVIYRTLSWQKVANIALSESLGDATEGGGGAGGPGSNGQGNAPLSYCWSPNGQCVAVALESSVFLYGVESLVTASGAGSGGGTTGGSTNATWTIDLLREQKGHPSRSSNNNRNDNTPADILGLHWVHVGKHHPTAVIPSAAEEEQEVSWR